MESKETSIFSNCLIWFGAAPLGNTLPAMVITMILSLLVNKFATNKVC